MAHLGRLWPVGLLEGCGLVCRVSWLTCPGGFLFLLKGISSSEWEALVPVGEHWKLPCPVVGKAAAHLPKMLEQCRPGVTWAC